MAGIPPKFLKNLSPKKKRWALEFYDKILN